MVHAPLNVSVGGFRVFLIIRCVRFRLRSQTPKFIPPQPLAFFRFKKMQSFNNIILGPMSFFQVIHLAVDVEIKVVDV